MELYIEHLLEVFREVKRVLRGDGTLWVNLGDSYSNDTKWGGCSGGKNYTSAEGGYQGQPMQQFPSGLKPKDLCMMPFRVAMALQSEGWYLRSVIPWIKRNAMPESVTDRPATAVEYVFMFSKSKTYFFDRYAVQVPASESYRNDGRWKTGPTAENEKDGYALAGARNPKDCHSVFNGKPRGTRTRRNSDWFFESWQGLLQNEDGEPLALIVNPVGTRIKHFASYPPKLIEPIIKAGTSEKGCCPKCGAQWVRLVESKGGTIGKSWHDHENDEHRGQRFQGSLGRVSTNGTYKVSSVGWEPSCACGCPDTIPCTVLDPFAGISTTGMVATNHGRHSILCELHPEYFEAARQRDSQGALAIL